ncbi:hypothetical protein OH77DRAFT_1509030 [Trametes cingulata]|nr:hypothetical protein OH77DRAFT_1509030 [Trametes cingulata]
MIMLPYRLSAQHPHVQTYIRCAAAFLAEAEDRSHPQACCTNDAWHVFSDRKQLTTWWRVEYGGIAHPEGVAHALNAYSELSLDDARRIFVLAALSVYSFPTHPAHWAFWARNSRMRVLQLVHEVVCEKPQRIVVPGEVAWLDVEYNFIGLCNYQKPWLPQTPRPSGVHAPEPQPKKPVKTRVVPRRGAERAKLAPVPAAPEAVPQRIGKRKRAAETTEEATGRAAEPARKRPKRGAATAVETREKEQKGGATKRKREAKAAQGGEPNAVEVPSEGAPQKPSPARKGRTKGRAGAKAKKLPAPPPTIHVDPPSEADMTLEVDIVGPSEHLSTPSSQLSAPRRASLRQYHTPRKAIDATPSSSPLSEAPSTPNRGPLVEPSSSPTPTRPSGRCLHRRTFSAAMSDTSEVSVTLSGTTAAASAAASDGSSTRAGTPRDVDMDEKMGSTEDGQILSPVTPVRASARIRAKKGASSPATPDSSPLAKRASAKRKA